MKHGFALARGVLVAFVASGLLSSCSTAASTTQSSCDAVEVLESDTINSTLTSEASRRPPTDLESKVATLYWGIAVLAAGEGEVDPFLTEVPAMGRLLSDIPSLYPELVPNAEQCEQLGTDKQALISSSNDFSCGNPCVPSPELLSATRNAIYSKLIGNFIADLKRLGKYYSYTQKVRTWLAEITRAQRSLAAQYKLENKVYLTHQQVADALVIVDGTVKLEDSQELLKDTLAVMADISQLLGARSLGLVLVAFQIGWEIGQMANLVIECQQYKATYCSSTAAGWSGKWAGSYTISFEDQGKKQLTNAGRCTFSFDVPQVIGSDVLLVTTVEFFNWRDVSVQKDTRTVTGQWSARISPTQSTVDDSVQFPGFVASMRMTRNGDVLSGTFTKGPESWSKPVTGSFLANRTE